jgi:hypothetical protein
MSSGYNLRFPDDVLIDTAVLKTDLTTPGVIEDVVGVSRGGLRFRPGKTLRNIEYDGRRFKVAGLDRQTSGDPAFIGTMLQVGPEDLRLFEAGASGTGNSVVLKPAGQFIDVDELHGYALTFDRKTGGTFTITFPYGIVVDYEIGSTDNNESEVPITIEARQRRDDASSSDGEIPYAFSYTDPA